MMKTYLKRLTMTLVFASIGFTHLSYAKGEAHERSLPIHPVESETPAGDENTQENQKPVEVKFC